MLRSFLPIGQGNCAVEYFNNFTAMFDCGSTDRNHINNIIDNEFSKGYGIDALFLSHFDEDHINGVEYLINKCDVRQVFIPYLTPKLRLLQYVHLKTIDSTYNSFVAKVLKFMSRFHILEPRSMNHNDKQFTIITIPEYNNSEDNTWSSLNKYRETVKSVTDRYLLNKPEEWFFIPFNYKIYSRTIQFDLLIKSDSVLKDIDENSVSSKWDLYYDRLKEIYSKKMVADINTNSMVVYSGPLNMRYKVIYFRADIFPVFNYKSAALYTGDYNAKGAHKFRDLVNYYAYYFDNIGTFTVPHHGSWLSYNIRLPHYISAVYVINYGSHSKNHPGVKTCQNINDNYLSLVLINEKSKRFTQQIGGSRL